MGRYNGWVVEGREAALDELHEGYGPDKFGEGLDDAGGCGGGMEEGAGAVGEEDVGLGVDDVD